MVRNFASNVNRKVHSSPSADGASTQNGRAITRCTKNVDWLQQNTTPVYGLKDGFRQEPSISSSNPIASRLNPNAKPFVPLSFGTIVSTTASKPNCLASSSTSPATTLFSADVDEPSGLSSPLMSLCSVSAAVEADKGLSLMAAAHMIPHPAKLAKGGEDAFFIEPGSSTIGVADGVGGWEALGVDSGLYSRSLMMAAAEQAARELLAPTLDLLQGAYDKCLRIPGSSTACVLRLRPSQRTIDAVNLGDSGFIIVRAGRVVFRTKEQQHYFNCPFQIGSSRDTPDDAARITVDGVQEGDLVVLASDGLWDNMHTEKLLALLAQGGSPAEMSRRVAEEAHRIAADPAAVTPFEEGARKNGQIWKGGKLDDITVLVAQVSAPLAVPPLSLYDGPSASPPPQMSPIGTGSPSSSSPLSVAPPPGLGGSGGDRRSAANHRPSQTRRE